MADSAKLARVVAMLCERDDDFKPFRDAAVPLGDDRDGWSLSALKELLA